MRWEPRSQLQWKRRGRASSVCARCTITSCQRGAKIFRSPNSQSHDLSDLRDPEYWSWMPLSKTALCGHIVWWMGMVVDPYVLYVYIYMYIYICIYIYIYKIICILCRVLNSPWSGITNDNDSGMTTSIHNQYAIIYQIVLMAHVLFPWLTGESPHQPPRPAKS